MIPGRIDEETIMEVAVDAGADDLADESGTWRLTCEASRLPMVRAALDAANVPFEAADVTMVATSSVAVEDITEARAVLRLIDLLDDQEDVQDVYANFDIPDEVLESL
jgi:transcriptional/translational regulatory protein YebC/TACO1